MSDQNSSDGALSAASGRAAAAVFVDFDNLFYGLLHGLYHRHYKRAMEECLNLLAALRAELGQRETAIVLGRAYSGFDEYPGSEAAHPLSLMGFDPQYVVQKKGKNSADLQLSLDLMEVLLTRQDIDLFVIVGGDRDFIPVARKVLEARRELLIVALPEVTSGDLIDRVGPERFMDAGLFITIPDEEEAQDLEDSAQEGKQHVVAPAEEGAAVLPMSDVQRKPRPESGGAPEGGARILGRIQLPQTSWRPLSDEEALSADRQEKCVLLLHSIAQRWIDKQEGEPEVWLSPFLKNEMADAFPHLTHPQRRRLVNLLKEQEKIRIEERESQTGPFPYSVVIINREHPDVVDLIGAD